QIERAKVEGAAGRKELLDRLARMEMDKVIGLPASSLAILGPNGLAKLAAMREDLAGTGRKAGNAAPPQSSAAITKASPRPISHPVRSLAAVVLLILIASVVLELSRPMLATWMFDPGVRSRQTSLWPSCPRLDGH